MVYSRKFGSRKRYARRRVSKLSKYNTYRYRSSAAQASQIYSLAKRVNRIQKLNKPEIKLAHYNVNDTLSFTEGIGQNTYSLLQNGASPLSTIIDGKFARLNSLTFTMSFRYEDASFVASSESTQRLPQPIYLRLLFVQFKSSRQTAPEIVDLFDTTSGFTRTRGPLADGSARVCKILSDKKFMVNYNHQTVNKVLKFKYLRNYYKPDNESTAKGDMRVYLQLWNPNSTADDQSTNVILSFNVKTAYTDA